MRILGRVNWQVDAKGDMRWNAETTNSNVVADSGEGYSRPIDARRGKLTATKILVADLTDEEFYAAAAYRSAVRAGLEPPIDTTTPDEPEPK